MRTKGVVLALELTFAAMLWILPGMVPAQHMLRGFLDIAGLPRISHQDRNLRPLSKSNNGDSSTSTKQNKGSKSSKSSKLSSKTSKQRKKKPKKDEPLSPPKDDPQDITQENNIEDNTNDDLTIDNTSPTQNDITNDDPPTTNDNTTPTQNGNNPPKAGDAIKLFSEDFEHPNYDFSKPELNYQDDPRVCHAPEGQPSAFQHWNKDAENTINLAYGKQGAKYSQENYPAPVYLQTYRDALVAEVGSML